MTALTDAALLDATRPLTDEALYLVSVTGYCDTCGKAITLTPQEADRSDTHRCSECAHKTRARRNYQKKIYETKHINRYLDALEYQVLRDPLPVEAGGFRPGAKLGTMDLRCLLAQADPETVGLLLERGGRHYRVSWMGWRHGMTLKEVGG